MAREKPPVHQFPACGICLQKLVKWRQSTVIWKSTLGNGNGVWINLNPTAALCAYLKAMTYLVGSLISQFCIETFFLKTSHGQMFTLQFISNVLLFRTVGGEGEAKSKPRHFVGMKDKVLLQSGGGGKPHAPLVPTGLLLECQSCK